MFDTKIAVCVDCAMLLANGEGTDEHAAAMAATWPGEHLVLGDTEDPWFSWSPCQGCGSTLGGDRLEAFVE